MISRPRRIQLLPKATPNNVATRFNREETAWLLERYIAWAKENPTEDTWEQSARNRFLSKLLRMQGQMHRPGDPLLIPEGPKSTG